MEKTTEKYQQGGKRPTKMAMKTRKEKEKQTKMPMDYKFKKQCRPQQPKRVNKLI
jgi:hypothetical protein